MARKIGWILSIAVLLLASALGLLNGFNDLDVARTLLQKSVTIGVLAHGVIGLAAGVALLRRVPAARWLTLAWAIIVTYVSATASLAYGGEDATLGAAIGGGLGAAVVAFAIYWCARAVTSLPNEVSGQRTEAVR